MSKTSKFLRGFAETIAYLGEVVLVSFEKSSFEHKMLKLGGYNPDQIYKGFKNLESRRILKRTKTGYAFTTTGQKWIKYFQLSNLRIKKHKWDSKWRLAIFDIPEGLRKQRGILRSKLKAMGFCMLQRSVFVIPYKCRKEVTNLCSYWGIEDYVILLTCDSIGNRDAEIRQYFDL